MVPSPRLTASGIGKTDGAELRSNERTVDFDRQRAERQARVSPLLVLGQRPVALRSMSAMIDSARAIPGVRSSSSCTRPGSMASRAAWRYSSRRCADTSAAPTIAVVRASTQAARLLPRELRTVVVGRIAINGMDVVDAALRRVLDHEGWPLNAEIRGATVRSSGRSRRSTCRGGSSGSRPSAARRTRRS